MKLDVLPENILRCMSAEDRATHAKLVGHPNAGKTSDELRQSAINKDEKAAQKEIANYLRMKGIEFINPAMNKKSPLPEGWPDFTLALPKHPIGLEVKVWGQKPRPEQEARHQKMRNNGWNVFVVSGVAEVVDILNTINP